MRVLQLIDSLRSGGAERMSVSYANALVKRIEGSFLCCTRKEGLLKEQLDPEVVYLYLEKKYTLDLQAFWKLRNFVLKNEIDLIHAHGSSWFLALLVKKSLPNVKLVWHDHWGERALKKLRPGILRPVSQNFNGVISVNPDLEEWARTNLKASKVKHIPNFIPSEKSAKENFQKEALVLKGDLDSFKIVCIANLRPPKDHMTLLRSFKLVTDAYPNTSLHLLGKDKNDSYSQDLKNYVKMNGLQGKLFFYGEQSDVHKFLLQADLGVLSSKSEGLPVALLEYGMCHLPVVCTRVGKCEELVKNCGTSVPTGDPEKFSKAIIKNICDPHLRKVNSRLFYSRVVNYFSETKVMGEVISFYSKL